jgi:hypothetical protein
VKSPFVGESGSADVWRANVVLAIGKFVDEQRELSEPAQIRDDVMAELELQVWNQAR